MRHAWLAMLFCLAAWDARAADAWRVTAFAGASNLPIWIGQTQGLFARHGLDVALSITPNSEQMARDLQHGDADLALTSIDNVVAYDAGEGEAKLDGPIDFVALFGVDDGMLSLVAAPSIHAIRDVAGQDFAVDAMTTGFAFVMRELMARNEIAPSQVRFVKVGGGAQRLQAVLSGQQKVTLLNTPLDIIAEAHGFHSLVRVTDVLGPYQGIVAAVRRDRVVTDRAKLQSFTAGFHESVAWLMRPEHREQAIALLVDRMNGMTRPTAEAAYATLTDPKRGIFRDLHIDRAGLRTVLTLRSRYAVPAKPLGAPAAYVDDSIRAAALR